MVCKKCGRSFEETPENRWAGRHTVVQECWMCSYERERAEGKSLCLEVVDA